MKPQRPKTVQYRRKRTLKTNYTKRLRLLMVGKPRLVVRLTNTQVLAQLVEFTPRGDKILVAVSSKDLRQAGWNYSCKNMPGSYLAGALIGKRALQKGNTEAILDTGNVAPLHRSRFYAFLKGVLDSGFTVPHGDSKKIFPSDERISGKHIAEYAHSLNGNSGTQHAQYLKSKVLPENITSQFLAVKKKILV